MKQILLTLPLLVFLFSIPGDVSAETTTFSCERKSIQGDTETLSVVPYVDTVATIILDSDKQEVSIHYLKDDRQWKTIYRITGENKEYLVGVSEFQPDVVNIFHFNKTDKTFSSFYAGQFGNTLNFGKCFQ